MKKNSVNDIYDVAIIGAGVVGASIARKMAAYDLKVAVLESRADVSFGVSKANSGIIHAGFHHDPQTLKARLEIAGNLSFEKLQNELNFPFKRVGILVVAFSPEEMNTINNLYAQGIANNIPRLEICSRSRLLDLEPKLNQDVIGGLYAPTGGIIEPYRFVFALMENAQINGVELFTDFKVSKAQIKKEYFTIISTQKNQIKSRYVINAAGLYADEVSAVFNAEKFKIIPRKGEEYLLQRQAAGFTNQVIFPVPTRNSKGMLVIPTVEGTMMVGPTAQEIDDKTDKATTPENLEMVFDQARKLIPVISKKEIITSFAGLRPSLPGNDFYITLSQKTPRLVQVAGIQSPGLTAAPAIADYVKELLKQDGLRLTEKNSFQPYLPPLVRSRELPPSALQQKFKQNPQYTNIICRCEKVSEAEIVEAIHKGHTTLDGIKFYTRAGMGICQGGFCTYKILKIIARETGVPLTAITKRGGQSYLVKNLLKNTGIKLNEQ